MVQLFSLLWDDTKRSNCPGRADFAKARYMKSFPLSNRIKVNEFAGLLNVFYIQGSTKIKAKMASQTITDEFIYVSVRGNERNT